MTKLLDRSDDACAVQAQNEVNPEKPESAHAAGTQSTTPEQQQAASIEPIITGRRAKRESIPCQVTGCEAELISEKAYYQRYRICMQHCNLPCLTVNGSVQRFCQQCGRFHDLAEFRKSCRHKLTRHNQRRRRVGSKRSIRRSSKEEDLSYSSGAEDELDVMLKLSATATRSRDPRPVCNTANHHPLPIVNPTRPRALPKASAADSGSSRAGWSLTERVLAAAQLSHAGACNDSVVPTVDAFGHTLFRNSSSDTITSRVPVYRPQEAAPQNANQANPCGLAEPLRPADEFDLDAVLDEILGEAPVDSGVVYSGAWDEMQDMATGLQPFAEVPQWLANVGPLVPDLGCVSFADMW